MKQHQISTYQNHQDSSLPPMAQAVPIETEAVIDNYISRPSLVQHQPSTNALHDSGVQALLDQGFPRGLVAELGNSKVSHPIRFWVVDNSGSMRSSDGNRLVTSSTSRNLRVISCTRWRELQESVEYHIELAGVLQAPTTFRLLNDPGAAIGPPEFGVSHDDNVDHDVQSGLNIIHKCHPDGVTPLTDHVREIHRRVYKLQDSLRASGQKAAVILATDGLPSDRNGNSTDYVKREFVAALRQLQTLPVWVVIRLCTDDQQVVEYYNNLDRILESPLEVLDDFLGEGSEIYACNPWLNYGLPLHRTREMGYHERSFDLLDERKLSKDEMLEFLKLLFGKTLFVEAPDMYADWKGFCNHLSAILTSHGKQWNPVKRRNDYWIDMKQLQWQYGEKRGIAAFLADFLCLYV